MNGLVHRGRHCQKNEISLKKRGVGALAVGMAMLFAASAHAATLSWDPGTVGSGASYGSGAWSGSANWYQAGSGDVVYAAGSDVIFGGTNNGSAATVTLSGATTANSLTFNTTGYAISGTSALTLSGATAVTLANNISATISAPVTWSIASKTTIGSGSVLSLAGGATLVGNAQFATVTNPATAGVVNFKSGTFTGTNFMLWLQTDATVDAATINAARFAVGYGGNSTITVNDAAASLVQTSGGGTFLLGRAGTTGTLNLKQGSVSVNYYNATNNGSVDLAADGASKGVLNVSGGTLTVAGSIYINAGAVTTGGYGTASFSGGTSTVGLLRFGKDQAAATDYKNNAATLNVSGGNLYVGAGGIAVAANVNNLASSVNLSGGTIGATANWSSSVNMSLSDTNGGVTFKSADASNVARDITLNGVLTGSGSLTKTGAGKLTLGGLNNYSGATTVKDGTLVIGQSGGLSSVSAMILNGGTVAFGGTSHSTTLASLTVSSASTLDFGGGDDAITFGDSSAIAWSGALKITNWDSAHDSLAFGGDNNALTVDQLNQIQFYDTTGTLLGTASWLDSASGQIGVAVPEPTGLGILGLGTLAVGIRKWRRIG